MTMFSKRFHALIDYPAALALVALPFLLGLGMANTMALYLSLFAGGAALLLTAVTDHQTGLLHLVPYRVHLAFDAALGAGFVAAPFLFQLTGIDATYYWTVGGLVLVMVLGHREEDEGQMV